MDEFLSWLGRGLSDWTMTKVFIACAAAGGTVLLGQFGLSLLGVGGADAEADIDLEGGEGLGILSVRAIAGFLTFFGLVGWMGVANGWAMPVTILAASAAGGSVMFLVAWLMRSFRKLTSHGNIEAAGAIGRIAQVYLRIPGGMRGQGKITVALQGRTVEFSALTRGEELPTGSSCRIVAKHTSNTFLVEKIQDGDPTP